MRQLEVPEQPGAYRWYYFDVTAGDFTAVFIFMIGSVFSARYSIGAKKGASPSQHSAVNFALYEKGVRRQWVLSEYPRAELDADQRTLRIGRSFVSYDELGNVNAHVVDRSAMWGQRVEATLSMTNGNATASPIQLIDGQSHYWHPIAPRSHARVVLPQHTLDGPGYHDSNFGDVMLGTDCPGWDWVRRHTSDATHVSYRPWSKGPGIRLVARDSTVAVIREALPGGQRAKTGWGLSVPSEIDGAVKPRLLESSPFYARLEGTTVDGSVLGEVADFERFHRPSIRWMARFRTRCG